MTKGCPCISKYHDKIKHNAVSWYYKSLFQLQLTSFCNIYSSPFNWLPKTCKKEATDKAAPQIADSAILYPGQGQSTKKTL